MNGELYPGEFEAMERQGRLDAVIPEQKMMTKQAIIGFMEFTKGITGNKDLKIPEDIAKEYGIDQDDTLDNLESEE